MEFAFYNVSKEEAERYFDNALSATDGTDELKQLFRIAVNSKDYILFPYISLRSPDFGSYLDKWIAQYRAVRAVTPTTYLAFSKAVTEDRSVIAIVASAFGCTEREAEEGWRAHRAFMSAESVQGYLLEEYVAAAVKRHGLLHCSGILKAVDFCSPDGAFLLQIKNKNNSENSPSVKTGLKVSLWYRVTPHRSGARLTYATNWEKLNEMVAAVSGRPCAMSEEGFLAFVRETVGNNRGILNC